jgi:hypothetical protein
VEGNKQMKRAVALGLLAALTVAKADAAVATFTTLAGWQAAAGAATLETFNATPTGPLAPGSNDIGAFSVFLDANGQDLNAINASGFLSLYVDEVGSLSRGGFVVRFDFDTPLIGFAASWASTTSGDRATISLAGSTFQFDNFLPSGGGFLGFVSTVPFSSVSFAHESASLGTDGEGFALDNARLATGITAAVSEPSAIAMLCLGLIGAGAMRRRC